MQNFDAVNLELWFRASGETNGSEQVDVRGWQLKRSRSEISNRRGVSKKRKNQTKNFMRSNCFWVDIGGGASKEACSADRRGEDATSMTATKLTKRNLK